MIEYQKHGIDIDRQGGEVYTTCPKCSQQRKKKKAKCLSVNTDKGVWTCHHCGWSGGLNKRAEVLSIGWDKPRYIKPERKLEGLSDKARAWLVGRKITAEVIERNKITSGSVYMPQVEEHRQCIQFPFFRKGVLTNIKHRDHQKNFRLETGAERIFYGYDDIEETTIIVEGEIDRLSVEVAGFKNCLSCPDGAPKTDAKDYTSKFEFLDDEKIKNIKTYIIAVDNDEPGKKLEDELTRRLGREKCMLVEWPKGCKDANDVLCIHGPEAVSACIESAKPCPVAGIFGVMDLSQKIDHLYTHGLERGSSTGYPQLDQFYTVRPGEFTVITGIPMSGKSNWLDALLVNLSKQHGWGHAIFSPENQPLQDHMARIIEKYAGFPFSPGPSMRMSKEDLDKGKAWVNEKFNWILPDDDTAWTLQNVLDMAKVLVYRKGIRTLVIDPWNELEHEWKQGESETQYISRSLKHIRQFGRNHGVHVFVVAHPQKLYRDKEGLYPVPTMYDISGSAHWRNKGDNGICIWRDFNAGHEIEVHVQKIKFRQIGRCGMVQQIYNPIIGTYSEIQQRTSESAIP